MILLPFDALTILPQENPTGMDFFFLASVVASVFFFSPFFHSAIHSTYTWEFQPIVWWKRMYVTRRCKRGIRICNGGRGRIERIRIISIHIYKYMFEMFYSSFFFLVLSFSSSFIIQKLKHTTDTPKCTLCTQCYSHIYGWVCASVCVRVCIEV